MAVENYLNNNFGVTLVATISNVSTSLTTTSAVSIDGGFRILLDSELMYVSSGATTTTWTVIRGVESTTANSHAPGAPINIVLTASAITNIIQNSVSLPWNPPPSPPPVVSSWTQVNPTSSGTFVDVRNGVAVASHSTTNNLTLLTKAVPTSPGTAFTLTTKINFCAYGANYHEFIALAIGDGTKYEVSGPIFYNGGLSVFMTKWNSSTSFASDYAGTPFATVGMGNESWFRLVYTGTGGSLSYQFSGSGSENTWTTYETHTATNFLAANPTVIGFGQNSNGASLPGLTNLVYWTVTTP